MVQVTKNASFKTLYGKVFALESTNKVENLTKVLIFIDGISFFFHESFIERFIFFL